MGLSSSKSKTTTNQSTTGSEQVATQQTPITPQYLEDAAMDYVGRIGAFGDMDPNSFVAGASPLQQMAWQNAPSVLAGWQPQAAAASQMASGIGQQGAFTAGPAAQYNPASAAPREYAAPGIASTPRPTAAQAPQTNVGSIRLADNSGYAVANRPDAAQATGQGYAPPTLGNASQVTGQGYQAPSLGNASLISANGYQAPTLGNAQGYAASRTGSPIGMTGAGYSYSGTNTPTIDPTTNAAASNANAASLLDNFQQYNNPYTQHVIDASLAQYDNDAGQQAARLAAQGAKSGAFGGSRFGIAEGQFAADSALGRASLGANLRDQGFKTAAGLSESDAANRQQASLFNAGNQTGVSLANAAAANLRAGNQAGLSMTGNLANQDAKNRAAEFNANVANTGNMFNADLAARFSLDQAARNDAASQFGASAQNQYGLAQAGLNENAGQFNANLGMQAGLANQSAQNQYGLAQAGLQADASRFGAQAANEAGFANAAAQNQFGLAQGAMNENAAQFGAQAGNTASLFNAGAQNDRAAQMAGLQTAANQFGAESYNQASARNADASNQFSLAQFGADTNRAGQFADAQNQMGLTGYQGDLQRNLAQAGLQADAGQFNANAGNQFNLANMAAANDAGQFNAAQQNQMGMFNAQQGDVAANRGLASAQLLGNLATDYGNSTRADLATMAQLGDQQRGIESEYTNAPVTQLGLMGQFSGMTPYDILVGRAMNGTTNSTGTLQGTQVTKSSPSLFDMAIAAGQVGAAAFSDRRLKTDIEKVGEEADGLGVYDFSYIWGGRHRGVMADEVASLRPWALGPVIGGYATVDYSAL